LKRADNEGRILETEPRDHLWQAQTPQMFRHGMLLRRAARGQRTSTDEAAAVEAWATDQSWSKAARAI